MEKLASRTLSLRTPKSWLGRSAVIALAYLLAGKAALLMAIAPGYATAVWPASGLALAALLIWGTRYWPAVAIGSFLVNGTTSLDTSSSAATARSLMICACIGLGAALESATASELIQRAIGFPTRLSREWDVGKFLLLGGPLSCLVSPTVGVATLLVAGSIDGSQLAFTWWTWWVGDTIGVMLVTPVMLIWAAPADQVAHTRRRAVAVPMMICAALVITIFVYVSAQDERRIRGDFSLRTDRLTEVVKRDLVSYAESIQSIRSYYEASERVDRGSFGRFVSRALARHPGVQALGWAPVVPAALRESYEAAARADGLRGFQFLELAAPRVAIRAAARPEYVVAYYLEPMAGNEAVLGFDIASDPTRAQTLRRAAASNHLTATPRIDLIQYPEAGVIVYLPVFATGTNASAVRGFAIGVFRMARLMSASLKGLDLRGVDAELLDVTDAHAPTVLWFHPTPSVVPLPSAASSRLRVESAIAFGGRHWSLRLSPTPAYAFLHRSWYAWAVLALGLLFTSLLGAFLLVVTGRAAAVEQQVTQQTSELSQRERQLRQIIQTAHDAFIASDASAHITEWNPQAEHTFGWTRAEVLGRDWIELIIPQEHRASYRRAFSRFVRTGVDPLVDHLVEGEGMPRSGPPFPMEMTMSPVRGSDDGWTFNMFLRDISAKKESERRILASLREKEVLLKEIHHRVKNNLQVVSSLLNLQAQHQSDSSVRELFAESQARVHSIALIHEALYQSENLARIDFDDYVRALLERLAHAHNAAARRINCEVTPGSVQLPIDLAIPCGLIINELVTNALKYAFPSQREGTVRVALREKGDLTIELVVADDGVGLPAGLDPRHTTTLGLDLVAAFAEQIGAGIDVRREGGTTFRFAFRRQKHEPG